MNYSHDPSDALAEPFRVARAANDLLFMQDGKEYVDLLSGGGSVLVGHANHSIVADMRQQLDALWNTGAVPTRIRAQAHEAVERYFPSSHRLAALYSTGMEAAEFALRVARRATARAGVIGFDGCMHGKSMATARLGWHNDLVTLPDFHRLPYLPHESEEAILENVRRTMAEHRISAVFLEPLLGSRGGHVPSRQFAQQLSDLCGENGCLLVIDEILTGFHRTGSTFLYRDLGASPDIVLIGKAMGNGFPVAGVVVDRRHAVDASALPGSTYAGNPLAAAAVVATLREIAAADIKESVAAIEAAILAHLGEVSEMGVALRGKGALWILELASPESVSVAMNHILRDGVMVSPTASFIRLLPAATIAPDNLVRACEVIRQACRAQFGNGP